MARQQGKPQKLQTDNASPDNALPKGRQNRDFLFDMHAALNLYPPGGNGRKTSCNNKPSEPNWDYETLLRHYLPQSRDLDQKNAADCRINHKRGEQSSRLQRALKRHHIDDTIDLHGLFQKEAQNRLHQFFEDAQSNGLRKICIIHGKGHHSSEGKGVLQGMVWRFLQMAKAENKVLEFHHPAERYGGKGATVALLNGKYRA